MYIDVEMNSLEDAYVKMVENEADNKRNKSVARTESQSSSTLNEPLMVDNVPEKEQK